jgi:hypothetical protein
MPDPTDPAPADETTRDEYSLCETAHAAPQAPWHIRRLTLAGKKLGGGADTDALCGRKVAWDLNVPMSTHHLTQNTCWKCLEALSARGTHAPH